MCRNYGIEKLEPQDKFNSSSENFLIIFINSWSVKNRSNFVIFLLDNKLRYLVEEHVTNVFK